MSRSCSLTTQTSKLFIVIRKNKKISKDLIKQYCDEFFTEYAFIEHEKDVEPKTGLIEGVHYHITGNARKKKTPLSTHLNDLCKFFRFDDNNGIEIEKYKTLEGSLQYLLHIGHEPKTPHDISELITNIPKEELTLYLTSDIGNVITFDKIYAICLSANNIIDVIRELGLKNYKDWRNVIWDIWKTMIDIERSSITSDYIK